MNSFELDCPYAADPVEIEFSAEAGTRGKAKFRGFICSHEAQCEADGVKCALYNKEGFEAFDVAEALRHLNG
jgi:hypothetical protein